MRAALWKYVALALAVLAVSAIVAALLFRGSAAAAGFRAATAEAERDELQLQVNDLKAAAKRDEQSSELSDAARLANQDGLAKHNERAARVEGIARERIVEVPAVCPGPDADLMRELEAGSGRVRGAESRLRSLGAAGHEDAR